MLQACAPAATGSALEGIRDMKLIYALAAAAFLALAISHPASADQLARTVRATPPVADGDPHWPDGTPSTARNAGASVHPQHVWLILPRIWQFLR